MAGETCHDGGLRSCTRTPGVSRQFQVQRDHRGGRAIQREIDRSGKESVTAKKITGAMRAGARIYPAPPFPPQHPKKPGREANLGFQPEGIAPAFVFLAAPSCSRYITGEVLPIIGGCSG
jgi:NAD(P)-dependent dehydrogenase (short-subunit alcohol dehydrogenase family)